MRSLAETWMPREDDREAAVDNHERVALEQATERFLELLRAEAQNGVGEQQVDRRETR